MLLANRRLRTIFIALAGMEASVLAMYLLLTLRWERIWRTVLTPPENSQGAPDNVWLPSVDTFSASTLVLFLWLGLLGIAFALDVLAQSKLKDHLYRGAVVLLVLISSLLGVRLLAFPGLNPFDVMWLVRSVDVIINFHRGLHPATFVLLLVCFLWFRAASMSSREINFFGVGLSFRLGMLLIVLGGSILAFNHPSLITEAKALLALYMAAGLTAVSLARSDEKAESSSGSAGSPLPLDRLAQLLLMVTVTITFALALAYLLTPQTLLTIIHFFDPVWALLGRVGQLVLTVFVLVMERIVLGVYWLLQPILAEIELTEALAEAMENLQFVDEQTQQDPLNAEPWPYAELLYLLIRILTITAIVGGLLFCIYIFVARRLHRNDGQDSEVSGFAGADHALGSPANSLRRGLQRLRRFGELVRQYGLGTQLLDAITVENIYANVSRLGRQQGQPRQPAQPPDQYLSALKIAFPDQEAALERITEAYMRVHYGDLPVSSEELARLRQDYRMIRSTALE